MSRGDLKAFHAAFVAADGGLDNKVCKNVTNGGTDDTDATKCNHNTAGSGGLDKVYAETNTEFDKVKAEQGGESNSCSID